MKKVYKTIIRALILSCALSASFMSVRADSTSIGHTIRLEAGKIFDLFFGLKDASQETQEEVAKIAQKLGVTHKIPVKQMNLLARLFSGYANAFAFSPGLIDRIYVNEEWLNQLSTKSKNFVLGHEMCHIKHKDLWYLLTGYCLASIVQKIMNDYRFNFFLDSQDHPVLERIPDWLKPKAVMILQNPKRWILDKLRGAPFILLLSAFSRWREKAADRAAAAGLNNCDGGIEFSENYHNYKIPNKLEAFLHFLATCYRFDPFNYLPFISKYFNSHPPLEERVRYLSDLKDEMKA